MKTSNNKYLYTVLVLIIAAQFATITSGHSWGCDFALYIMQAEAIGSPTAIQQLKASQLFAITHSDHPFTPVFYPWMQPVLLKIINLFVHNYLLAGKLLNILALAALLLLSFKYIEKNSNKAIACCCILLTGLLPTFIIDKNSISADFISLLAVWLFIYHIQKGIDKSLTTSHFYWAIGAGAVVAFACLTRVQNIVLLPVLAVFQLHQLYQHQWKGHWLVIVFPYVVFAALCVAFVAWLPFPDYSNNFSMADHAKFSWLNNALFYPAIISQSLWIGHWHFWITILLLPFTMVGGFLYYKKTATFLAVFAVTIILLIVTPFEGAFRYVYFVVPVYFLYTIGGFLHLAKKLPGAFPVTEKRVVAAWVLPALFFVMFAVRFATKKESPYEKDGPYSNGFIGAARWIDTNIPAGKAVAYCKPRAMLMMSHHHSFNNSNIDLLQNSAAAVLVNNYDPSEKMNSVEFVQAMQAAAYWKPVVLNNQFTIWLPVADTLKFITHE